MKALRYLVTFDGDRMYFRPWVAAAVIVLVVGGWICLTLSGGSHESVGRYQLLRIEERGVIARIDTATGEVVWRSYTGPRKPHLLIPAGPHASFEDER